jgi:hypothetical protein
MEKTYAFIKDGIVENTYVFADKDDNLAESIRLQQGFDSFVYVGEKTDPARWSSYNGKTFTAPSDEFLIEKGILTPVVVDETLAE